MSKRIWLLGLTALAFACASTLRVRTDYDRNADFSRFRTFSIRDGNSTGNPVMDQRIKGDVEAGLRAKGLQIERQGEGDLVFVTHAATRTRRTYDAFYDTWGPGWRWRWGQPEVVVNEFRIGTLVVDAFDAKTKTAVWHGYASDVLSDNPEKNGTKVDEAVDELVKRFPPEGTRQAGN